MAVDFVSRRPASGFSSSAALRGKHAAIKENVITSSWDVFIGLARIEQIGKVRDERGSREGEHRGLGSRGVDGKAARVAVLERERKNK
jgi:hypothetical protein